jgi:hypothetical protein
MTIPIIVRIPQRVLSACYQTIPRPPWEFRTYSLWLCTLLVFTVLIFVTAIYDSRRLFDNVNEKCFQVFIPFIILIVFNTSRMAE